MSPFPTTKKENVAVIGLDPVGVALAIWARRNGYNVFGIDPDYGKVARLQEQIAPFARGELAREYDLYPFDVSSEMINVVHADIVILCIPPVGPQDSKQEHRKAESYVRELSKSIGFYLQKDQLIILQSVLNSGVSIDPIKRILESTSSMTAEEDFQIIHFPQKQYTASYHVHDTAMRQ